MAQRKAIVHVLLSVEKEQRNRGRSDRELCSESSEPHHLRETGLRQRKVRFDDGIAACLERAWGVRILAAFAMR